jgi:hypothetical protein
LYVNEHFYQMINLSLRFSDIIIDQKIQWSRYEDKPIMSTNADMRFNDIKFFISKHKKFFIVFDRRQNGVIQQSIILNTPWYRLDDNNMNRTRLLL